MEDMLFKQIEYFGITPPPPRFFHFATFVLHKCPQNLIKFGAEYLSLIAPCLKEYSRMCQQLVLN